MDQSIVKAVRVDNRVYMVPARALTLTPPWQYFMLHLPPEIRKDVENRVPNFNGINFRGWCWVHTATKMSIDDYEKAATTAHRCGVPDGYIPSYETVQFEREFRGTQLNKGVICGAFRIDGREPPNPNPKRRWAFSNHHVFPVSGATAVPSVACTGHLGFWNVPYDTLCSLVRGCLRERTELPFNTAPKRSKVSTLES